MTVWSSVVNPIVILLLYSNVNRIVLVLDALFVSNHFVSKIDGEEVKDIVCENGVNPYLWSSFPFPFSPNLFAPISFFSLKKKKKKY